VKFLPYVVKNVLRHKLRNIFTCISIGVSLFLVTLLHAYLTVQDELGAKSVEYNRLVATHAQGLTFPIPIAYVDKVRSISGVKAATQLAWFGGKYKDDRLPFAQFATDPKNILRVFAEYTLTDDEIRQWQNDRTGCVVGSKIARKRGWKLGDKIPIKGDIYPVNLELTVRGIYNGPETADLEMLWYHYTYLDELLKKSRSPMAGNAGTIFIKAESADVMPNLMRDIDARFASSDSPVRTMTEEAFRQMFTEMLGNVRAYIFNVSAAVVFSLVCVAGNAMAMSMRERTREVAVLKAIGFGRGTLLSLVLSEGMLVALAGGVLGVFGAKLLFDWSDLTLSGIPGFTRFYVPWSTMIWGLFLAAGVGLASGALPAWRAAQVSVVNGLRKVV
jgi:putative ABC transport system permease protein